MKKFIADRIWHMRLRRAIKARDAIAVSKVLRPWLYEGDSAQKGLRYAQEISEAQATLTIIDYYDGKG